MINRHLILSGDIGKWGCLEYSGKYWSQTTTWNGRQLNPDDDFECSIYRAGHKVSGRFLDGREWNELPEVTP
jgi:hypothetical protein